MSSIAGPLSGIERMSHGQTMMIDRGRLLPATYQFNPSIANDGCSLWMVYRRISPDQWLAGPRTLGLCRLNPDFQPDPSSNVDLSAHIEDPPGTDRWHADPRLFFRGRQLWMSHHDNYRLCLTHLEPAHLSDRLLSRAVELVGRAPRSRERNWGFFDDGVLKAIYTIRPHVVLVLEEDERRFAAFTRYETDFRLPWDVAHWGEPHGGCMPTKVGEHWFAFFQSASYDSTTERRHYHVGLYGFDAEPPHRITFMSRRPILSADAFDGERSFYKDWAVVYPSGAVFCDGRWLVSLGIHDRKPGLVVFDHAALLHDCARLG